MKTTNSKTIPLILAAFFICTQAMSATPYTGPSGTSEKVQLEQAIKRALNKYIVFPVMERERDMFGEVVVSFAVNKAGGLEVIECSSENKDLRDYVRRKLAMIDVGENPSGLWKITSVRFVFRSEGA